MDDQRLLLARELADAYTVDSSELGRMAGIISELLDELARVKAPTSAAMMETVSPQILSRWGYGTDYVYTSAGGWGWMAKVLKGFTDVDEKVDSNMPMFVHSEFGVSQRPLRPFTSQEAALKAAKQAMLDNADREIGIMIQAGARSGRIN